MSNPYQAHSDTSKAAAHKAHGATQRVMVMRYLVQRGSLGATDEEMQEALNLNPSTQRPRRIELVAKETVRNSGRTRKTRSGRDATIWVACKSGEQLSLVKPRKTRQVKCPCCNHTFEVKK